MTSRRLLAGALVVLVYVGLAMLSGSLSPMARRPILDGLAPLPPYNWVTPPPELAPTNTPPATGDFEVPLGADGSEPGVFLTGDGQVTIVVDRGDLRPHGTDTAVRLQVIPLASSGFAAPVGGLTAFGNVLELRATYEPSGDSVRRPVSPLQIVLTYPATQTLHATTHEIQLSDDGTSWIRLPTADTLAVQQAQADVERFGFLVVAAQPTPNPLIPTPQGTGRLTWVLLVGSAAALAAGVVLIWRNRRPH